MDCPSRFVLRPFVRSLYQCGRLTSSQVVEHYRNLWNFVRVIHEKEEDGMSICSPMSCPRMSAGQYVYPYCVESA